jgi:hypothetical protein
VNVRSLILGLVSGSVLTILAVAVTGGLYEYRFADCRDVRDSSGASQQCNTRELINEHGYHIVPGQERSTYLRRPRIRMLW